MSTKHPCVIIISLSNHCASGGSGGRFEWIDGQSPDLSCLLDPVYLSISLRLFPIRQSWRRTSTAQNRHVRAGFGHMSHETLRNWRGSPSGANGSAQEWADFLTSLGNSNLGWTLRSRARTHPLNLISAGLSGWFLIGAGFVVLDYPLCYGIWCECWWIWSWSTFVKFPQ